MLLQRRSFLKMSAGACAAMAFGGLGFDLSATEARAEIAKFAGTKLTTSICCYCAVGCGVLVHTADNGKGMAVNIEGDPDHPINEGSLCPKGSALRQLGDNKARPPKPLYRAPKSSEWKEVEWDWALKEIAKRVKKTRDATFVAKNELGETVNRTEGIVSFGSAALDNEECWTYQAFLRSLGLVNIEHQARI
jgi:formate dehydrogenase major subunit